MVESTAIDTEKARKREAILDAAVELFGSRGFYGTAVPLVAEKAGVGAGTIYRYFDSKEALVNAAYQHSKQQLMAVVLDDFQFDAPARTQFHLYWSRMFSFALANPAVMLFLEMHHHMPYLDEGSRQLEEMLQATAAMYLEKARQDQVIKDVPVNALMSLIHGAFVGLLKEHLHGNFELDDALIQQTEECCWQALRL